MTSVYTQSSIRRTPISIVFTAATVVMIADLLLTTRSLLTENEK